MTHRVLVWGDGSVGTGLAVALSASADVVLVGPPGSGRGAVRVRSTGSFPGTAEVLRAEAGDRLGSGECIVAVKAYHIPEVSVLAADCAEGPCLCLSNGMGLDRLWGPDWDSAVEPVVLTAGFRLASPGLVETYPGRMIAMRGGLAERLLAGCGIDLQITDDIDVYRWAKWLVNSVINPLGAITGLTTDRLLDAGMGPWIQGLSDELGSVTPTGIREKSLRIAGGMMDRLLSSSGNRCSMLQDIENGRRTEIDSLTGYAPPDAGRVRPLSGMLTSLVRALEGKG